MTYNYLTVEEQASIKTEYIKGIEESHLRNTLYIKELEGKIIATSEDTDKVSDLQRLKTEALEKVTVAEETLTSLKKESAESAK